MNIRKLFGSRLLGFLFEDVFHKYAFVLEGVTLHFQIKIVVTKHSINYIQTIHGNTNIKLTYSD